MAVLSFWPPAHGAGPSLCEVAFEAREWARVAAACRDARWGGRAELARAWLRWAQRAPEEALEIAERLLDSNVAADAAYLAGYLRGHRDASEHDRARALLHQALIGYQAAGRHADASRAASFLSRVPRPEARFEDELRMAQLAVAEAELGGDAHALGRAAGALAESYDSVGMADAARDAFLKAEELIAQWPEEIAYVYFNHALFLLDRGSTRDLENALRYLDDATAQRDRAGGAGLFAKVADLGFAIRLNRADALSQLGRLEAAAREVAVAERELGPGAPAQELSKLRLVQGYVAAQRHDLATAEALFARADDGSLESDYRWRVAVELARLHRRAGHPAESEQAYRAAIDIIEGLRRTAGVIELRPWVLARRTLPYVELLALLVERDRGTDALAVAEALHARAWLDLVLDRGAEGTADAEHALTAARIRQHLDAAPAPALDGPTLMARVGDREALLFLAAGETTWRAHVLRGRVRFQLLPADSRAVIERFIDDPDDRPVAAAAAAVLLPAELAAGGEPLYVIASGYLADVPFAALRLGDRYLIEHRPIARLPGLAALRCASSTWDDRVVVLGDSRGDLDAAAREAERLARSSGVVAHLGSAATREALAPAHRARLLHLAVHGAATSSGRAIVLADGRLTAADVLEQGLDPELVVLSGCATAVSDDAESWSGFPSAFLAAGSHYVIATLRSIADDAAARITSAYYDQPASLNPIERLAAAQRALVHVLPASAWSSFTAWGSAACPVPAPVRPAKAATAKLLLGASDPIDPWPPPPGPGRYEFLFDPG